MQSTPPPPPSESLHVTAATLALVILPIVLFLYWHRNHRGSIMESADDNNTPAQHDSPAATDENDGDGFGFGATRPPPPNGYQELCVLRSKVPDDDRFISAQNGFTFFGRRPPDDDDIERERRVLYIPSPSAYVPPEDNQQDNENNRPDKLTAKELSDLVQAAVDAKHYKPEGGALPTVGFLTGKIAGLFFEPDQDGGKAIFVPISSIAKHPEQFCGIERRDYYVLNPDVMEDEATENSLDNWRHGIRTSLFITGMLHIYVWYRYNIVVSAIVPAILVLCFVALWSSQVSLRNGCKLNEKLVDEAFFVYDFLSDSTSWIQMIILLFGYLYMLGW